MQAAKICSIPAFGRPQLPCHCTRDSETHTHPSHLSCSPLTSPISCLCLLPLALSSPISRVHSNARVGVRAHCCRCSPGSSGGADAEQEGSCRTEKVLQWAGKGDNKQNMVCFISCRAGGHGNGWVLGSRKLPFFLSFICPGVSLQLAAYLLATVCRWPVACTSAMQRVLYGC